MVRRVPHSPARIPRRRSAGRIASRGSGARSGVHEESLGGATVARKHVLERFRGPLGIDAPGPIGDLRRRHATSVRKYANSPRRPEPIREEKSSARRRSAKVPAGSARTISPLYPSRVDPCRGHFGEAALAGRPVIASAIPGRSSCTAISISAHSPSSVKRASAGRRPAAGVPNDLARRKPDEADDDVVPDLMSMDVEECIRANPLAQSSCSGM